MALYKFKEKWVPTPLIAPGESGGGQSSQISLPVLRPAVSRARLILRFALLWFLREIKHWFLVRIRQRSERTVEAAREAREFAERMGGMWVILSRLLSSHSDLLGTEFGRELARTRDRPLPMISTVELYRLLDEELRSVGTSVQEVFSELDPVPLTTKSFGQFHRARLRGSGREVAIRLRTPDALERANTDAKWLQVIVSLLKRFNLAPHMRWEDLLFEAKKVTSDLLDFRTELAELREIRKILRPRRVYVPLVYGRLCTERLLITEYIRGVSVADLQRINRVDSNRAESWLAANRIERKRVWRRLFNAHQELLFEHDLFYTELLPGSILLLRDNRLALVSLNTIGKIDRELQRKYRRLAQTLLDSNYTKACDTFLAMGPALPYKDITDMRQSAARNLRAWEMRTHIKSLPYREKSIAAALSQLARCAIKQKLPTFWNLARLQMAERTLEPTLAFLGPNKNGVRALRGYERSAQLRAIKHAAKVGGSRRLQNMMDMGRLNMQLIENIEHDAEYLRRRLMSAQGKVSGISKAIGRMMLFLARIASVALVLQVYLYFRFFTGTFQAGSTSAVGRTGVELLLESMRVETRSLWVALVLSLIFANWFLRSLAHRLFTPEIRTLDLR